MVALIIRHGILYHNIHSQLKQQQQQLKDQVSLNQISSLIFDVADVPVIDFHHMIALIIHHGTLGFRNIVIDLSPDDSSLFYMFSSTSVCKLATTILAEVSLC